MEGCHPQPTALFSVVRRWILYVPPGPDFLDDETTLRGPFGGPNLSAGVLAGSACCGSGGLFQCLLDVTFKTLSSSCQGISSGLLRCPIGRHSLG